MAVTSEHLPLQRLAPCGLRELDYDPRNTPGSLEQLGYVNSPHYFIDMNNSWLSVFHTLPLAYILKVVVPQSGHQYFNPLT